MESGSSVKKGGRARKTASWIFSVMLIFSMCIPNAALAAPAATSQSADEPVTAAQAADAAGTAAVDASAQSVPEDAASSFVYGTMDEGEAWDGRTVDVSWYNTTDTAFTISTAAQLAGLAQITSPKDDYAAWTAGTHDSKAEGIAQDNFKGKTVKLGADINLGGKLFNPISDMNNWGGGGQGTSDGTYDGVAWEGIFDGDGHTVSGLHVDGSVNCSNNFGGYQGFISAIGIGGKVQSLGVTGYIYGRVVGGIVGCSNTDASSTLTTSMADWPIVQNCWTDVEAKGNGSSSRGAGGIFGGESDRRAMCNVINCYTRGTVNNSQAGGVTGSTNGIVAGCYNTGTVTGNYTGSIVSTLYMKAATSSTFKGIGLYASNMALSGTSDNVWRRADSVSGNPTAITEGFYSAAELKAGASTLGSGYVADTNNTNNGYPILFWQNGEEYKSIENATTSPIDVQSYTGSSIEPVLTVKDGSTTLVEGVDYYVVYENNLEPGVDTAKATVYGIGRYTGTAGSVNFTIKQLDLSGCTIDPVKPQWSYGENDPAAPALTVKDVDGNVLAEGTDYTVKYVDNVVSGTATATVEPASTGTIGSKSVEFTVIAASGSLDGSGTAADPYLISSKGDLQFLAHQVKLGNEKYASADYKVTSDINAAAANENDLAADPIGGAYQDANKKYVYNFFGGNFDGDGHTITLGLDEGDVRGYAALFANVGDYSAYANPTRQQKICNLTIDGYVKGKYVGSIVGYSTGAILTIENCTNKATVGNLDTTSKTATMYAGGIAYSMNYGTFKNCKNEGVVQSAYSSGVGAGILAYHNSTSHPDWALSFVNCVNSGNVSAPSTAAGIIGTDQNQSPVTIVNCANTANMVSTSTSSKSGGLVGSFSAYGGKYPLTIDSSYNTGNVEAQMYAAGICASAPYGALTITNTYNTGTVSALRANYGRAGGFVGFDSGNVVGDRTVSGYNSGQITGTLYSGTFFGSAEAGNRSRVTTYNISGSYLSGTDAIGSQKTSSTMTVSNTAQACSEGELKALPDILGSAFVKDDGDTQINNGWPVLFWQKGIALRDLSDGIANAVPDQTYTGSSVSPQITVSLGGDTLQQGRDFTVEYADNVNAGTASATLSGVGVYTGELEVTFRIVPQNVSAATVADIPDMWTSSIAPAKPVLTVSNAAGAKMTLGTDYTVSYSGNVDTGEAVATVEGLGNYTGAITATYHVEAVATAELEGSGADSDPYIISSKDDLEFVAIAVNSQAGTYRYASYKVGADIDASASDGRLAVEAIGISGGAFMGSFDGDGHVITLGLTDSTSYYKGLFGILRNADIENVVVDGLVSGQAYVGGIAGYVFDSCTFTNCINNATIATSGSHVGGIAGCLSLSSATDHTEFSGCSNNGTVRGNGCLGGIVGSIQGAGTVEIVGCSNSATVTGTTTSDDFPAGGLVGLCKSSTTISKSFNVAGISTRSAAGGIIGKINLAGTDPVVLQNVYNTGDVDTSTLARYTGAAGGLVGICSASSSKLALDVDNCYVAGDVHYGSTAITAVGCLVGKQDGTSPSITVDNTYYKTGSTTSSFGSSTTSLEDNSVKLSDAEMKATGKGGLADKLGAAFSDDVEMVNDGYPVLAPATSSNLAIANIKPQVYEGTACVPDVVVVDTSKVPSVALVEGTDYLLAYEDNDTVGTATVTAAGIGDYAGQLATTSFEIAKGQLSSCTVADIPAQVLGSEPIKPELEVTSSAGVQLVEGVDYAVFYYNNSSIGQATYLLLGKGCYEGMAMGNFQIVGHSIENATVVMPDKVFYTGEALSPVPQKVQVEDAVLELGVDYEVTGYTDALDNPVSEVKDQGLYKAVLAGIGNYAGETTASFEVSSYLTVYAQANGGETTVVREFTQDEVEEMAESGSVSAIYQRKGTWNVSTATSYVTLSKLLGAAGLADEYSADYSASVTFASGDYKYTETYANLEGGKFYPATTASAIDETLTGDAVPAVLALQEASSAIAEGQTAADTAAANAEAASSEKAPRSLMGATEEAYAAGSAGGNRLVSNVDSITISYTEPPVFKLQVLYADSDTPVVAKEYSASEFKALKSDGDPVSAMFYKSDVWNVATATEYVTFSDLFADAGLGDLWTSGASVCWSGNDPSTPGTGDQTISYDELQNLWFFPDASGASSPNPENKVAAPAVLSITEYSSTTGSGDVLTAADAQNYNIEHANEGNFPRNLWGISEDVYTNNPSAARGRSFWSGNQYLTIVTDQLDPNAPEVTRIAGDNAVETSTAIATEAWADGQTSDWAILARSDDFADAMCATGLAGALDAPIVLTSRDGLSDAASAKLVDLRVKHVYVIGGPGAMPGDFEGDLEALGITAERISGASRDETSVKCAEKIAELGGSEYAIVARSNSFRDALSMSSFAYKYHVPILLQSSADDPEARVLSDEAQAMLTADGAFADAQVFVPGGNAAVTESSMAFLGRDYTRISGENGYKTSLRIADYMVGEGLLSDDIVCVASGATRSRGVDALAGAALAGRNGGVMLLVNAQPDYEDVNTTAIDSFITAHAIDIDDVYVLGGTTPMPDALITRIEQMMGI